MLADSPRLRIAISPARGWQVRIKYLADRLLACSALVLLAPVLAVLAALVVLDDPGPMLFGQRRIGEGGKSFRIWKFRTMVVDADRLLDREGRVRGNRVTRVGRWLRLTSLDELPQLLNIAIGEMSCVGPRPVLPSFLPRMSERQWLRFAMRPGVTGLAQVRGRNTLPWSLRLASDVEYVEGYSLGLDLRILWRTVVIVLRQEGIVLDRNPQQVDDLPPAQPGSGPGGQ